MPPEANTISSPAVAAEDRPSARAARSFGVIAQVLGGICTLFSVTECRNYFKAAGYEASLIATRLKTPLPS
ncbi:hypothetical protein E5S70_35425 [Ensifer adhaerens]|nr:hypothetical protein [Ensifer canadensis]